MSNVNPVANRYAGQATWNNARGEYQLGADGALGDADFEGIAIGAASEIDGILVTDEGRFSVTNPLYVSVGQPYSGRLRKGALWVPAKTGLFASGGPAPKYEVLIFNDGVHALGYRKRGRYTKGFSGTPADAQKEVFFVAGRSRVSFAIWGTDFDTLALKALVVATVAGPTSLNRNTGPAILGSGASAVFMVFPPTGSTFQTPPFQSFPVEPNGIRGGFDMLQFGFITYADGSPVPAVNIMVVAED